MKINYLSLFAGIGGFDEGLHQAGFEFGWHGFSEIDKHAKKIFQKHFPLAEDLGDVRTIKLGTKREIDLVTFGFPCTDLSIAGKRKGLQNTRSGLFFEAIKIIRDTRPRYFIFENVMGLLSSSDGKDIEIVIDNLIKSGYCVDIGMMDTAWVLPQNRKRIYGVGKSWKSIIQEWEKNGINENSNFSKGIIEGFLLTKFQRQWVEPKDLFKVDSPDLALIFLAKKEFLLNGLKMKSQFLEIIKKWELESLKIFCRDILMEPSKQKDSKLELLLNEFQQELQKDITLDMNEKMEAEALYSSIEKLLKNLSEENLKTMSRSIMSTWIKIIMMKKTFTFAEIEDITHSYIITLSLFSPDYLQKVLLDLTKKMENMKFAENRRSADENNETDLFNELQFSSEKGCDDQHFSSRYPGEKRRPEIFPITESDVLSTKKNVRKTPKARSICTGQRHFRGAGESLIVVINKDQFEERKIINILDTNYFKGPDCHRQRSMIKVADLYDSSAQGGRIYDPNGLSCQIISQGGGLGVQTGLYATRHGIRRLTSLECERLQGFEDRWCDGISETQKYRCLGNAVSVPIVKLVAEKLRKEWREDG